MIAAVDVSVVPAREAGRKPHRGNLITPLSKIHDGGALLREDRSAGLTPGATWAVVVEVSDTDDRVGVGTAGFGHPACVPVLDQFAPLLLGRDPLERELLWETLYRSTLNIGRRGIVLQAISAVDIALWDLVGKQLGVPVYDLLGGRVRPTLPAYASWLYAREDLGSLAAEAAAWVSQGYAALKQRLAYGPADGARGIRKNIELIRTVSEAAGPDIDVIADAYMGWDLGYAVRCIRAIEDAGLRLRWIEEPLIPDDIRGFAALRRAVSTPIAAGEHEATRYGFRDLIAAEAVDIMQPDVNRLGGITEARKVWALGESWGVDVIPHVNSAHNMHLSIASHATPLVEYMPVPEPGLDADEDQFMWELFLDEPRPQGGVIAAPTGPGLGVTVNRDPLVRVSHFEKAS